MTKPLSAPAPSTDVYAALWLGALLVATGAPVDPLPPSLYALTATYFELYPPEVKA